MRRPCSRCSLWPLEAGPSKCLAAPPPSAVVCPRCVATLVWSADLFGAHTYMDHLCQSRRVLWQKRVVSRNFVNGDRMSVSDVYRLPRLGSSFTMVTLAMPMVGFSMVHMAKCREEPSQRWGSLLCGTRERLGISLLLQPFRDDLRAAWACRPRARQIPECRNHDTHGGMAHAAHWLSCQWPGLQCRDGPYALWRRTRTSRP